MGAVSFPKWLNAKYKNSTDRFGDLAKNMSRVMRSNIMDENFESYVTLKDWVAHLDMHCAPASAVEALHDAWSMYVNGEGAEIDAIK